MKRFSQCCFNCRRLTYLIHSLVSMLEKLIVADKVTKKCYTLIKLSRYDWAIKMVIVNGNALMKRL